MDNLVNFDDIQDELSVNNIEFDFESDQHYKVLRKMKLDPISQSPISENIAFKFPYIWDPYTGTRSDKLDPDGPLYFDPDILIKYYYTNRLNKLWVNPVDDHTGYYQGYYGEGLGLGEEFNLIGRGPHPEWYLFRLPIPDCYLPKNYNPQHITFGPKLTDGEILEIYNKANLKPDNYKKIFNSERPSLLEIKKLYDIAISKKYSEKLNREIVNHLIKIKG